MKGQQKSIFLDSSPNKPSQFIFDELYKSVADKNKFSQDPKFTYFNTIIKMKSKLAQQKNQVYSKLFVNEGDYENPKNKSFYAGNSHHQQSHMFSSTQPLNFYNKQKKPSQQFEGHNKKFSVTKVNFKFDHKRRNSNYHSQKPRLDDILAEYKRMDRTSRLHETKSASLNPKKKSNPLEMLKTNGGFLPKCLPRRKKRQSSFL